MVLMLSSLITINEKEFLFWASLGKAFVLPGLFLVHWNKEVFNSKPQSSKTNIHSTQEMESELFAIGDRKATH